MNKAYFVLADNLCYHADMRNITAKPVGSEKHQIAFFYVSWVYLFAVAALLIRSTRKGNINGLERSTQQPRAIHAYTGGASPLVGSAGIGAGCLYNGGHIFIQVTGAGSGAAGAVFRGGDRAACPAAFSRLALLCRYFAGRFVRLAALAESRACGLAGSYQQQKKDEEGRSSKMRFQSVI